MTEISYQEGRKVMQKANYWRGMITKAKGNVAKWTKIEMSHRENLSPAQADGAKKALEKALTKLDEMRKQFADLKFPPDNSVPAKDKTYHPCFICGTPTYNETYCYTCEEDYLLSKEKKR